MLWGQCGGVGGVIEPPPVVSSHAGCSSASGLHAWVVIMDEFDLCIQFQ
jgi:hypothetical protein